MKAISFLISGMFVIAAFAGGFLFLWPAYQELAQLQAEVHELEERVSKGGEISARLREVRRQAQGFQEEFDKVDRALPQELSLPGVYHTLEQLGASSGLFLTGVDASTSPFDEQNEHIAKTAVSLDFVGSYENARNFMRNTRVSPRLVNVRSVEISSPDSETGNLTIRVQVEVYTASLKQAL